MPEFIVIGAGISGLTVAHKLALSGKDVIVLESSGNAGGKIATERIDGYLLEAGPNSLRIENQETVDLIHECGLTSHMIVANPNSKKRFILKNRRWITVPSAPSEAISTPLLSVSGKLRMLLEPFIPKTTLDDESVASFISRRLGREILDQAADPFISGIYAGDARELSMRHAFPQIWNIEQQHGSLLKGMMKGRKGRSNDRIKPRVISFNEGLSELTNIMKANLGDRLQLQNSAVQIEQMQNGFAVKTERKTIEARRIILSSPAYDIAMMLQSFAPKLSNTLFEIDYPPVTVVYLGYKEGQFTEVPEGFGGLIPSKENRKILGVIFSSSNFQNRAPVGHVLLTVLMGGARHPEIASWSNEKIIDIAATEINDLLKTNNSPVFQLVKIWKQAIPQYNIGYGKVLSMIEQSEQNNPGLHFLGNYRGGISVGACIKNATELAKRLV